MSRVKQPVLTRGSQHWLRVLANEYPHAFAEAVLPALSPRPGCAIEWRAPLKSDEYAEYRDAAFLTRLGISLPKRQLSSFWPQRGPVWDGLATTSHGHVLLIEAKANIPELASTPCLAGTKSFGFIESSMAEAKPAFGAPRDARWSGLFYQYANRLAHLYLLRSENFVPAYLVFLYFYNAHDVGGPTSPNAWHREIHRVHESLQLSPGSLTQFVLEVFIDAERLKAAA